MGVKLAAALGGSVELAPTNTASNYTATMPAATGTVMVSGGMPAFSAYRNASQTIGSTVTTIVFDTELYDTASAFDTTTGLFTAPVAGYYIFQGSAGNSTTSCTMNQRFKKNASDYYFGNYVSGNANCVSMSAQIYLAVGDTVGYQVAQSVSQSIATGLGFYFSGCLVRSA